jgi:acyl-CoA thioesterase
LDEVLETLAKRFREEPYARLLGMELVELEAGRAAVRLKIGEGMSNLFGTAHGGVLFSAIDGVFELAANSYGTVAVALSMNVNFLAPAPSGMTVTAEAREVSRSNRISTYQIELRSEEGWLIASCQAMAYRKRDKLPFL